MLKTTILNILLYFFVKYMAFYTFLMFKDSNFKLLNVNNIKNGADLFYFLWLLLFLPVVCMIIFTALLYFSFRVKNAVYFFLIIGVTFIAEYFLYVYLTSQKQIDINGVYNGILSILFLLLFFFKHISVIVKQDAQ